MNCSRFRLRQPEVGVERKPLGAIWLWPVILVPWTAFHLGFLRTILVFAAAAGNIGSCRCAVRGKTAGASGIQVFFSFALPVLIPITICIYIYIYMITSIYWFPDVSRFPYVSTGWAKTVPFLWSACAARWEWPMRAHRFHQDGCCHLRWSPEKGWCPPVVSWFIKPYKLSTPLINYSYIMYYHVISTINYS